MVDEVMPPLGQGPGEHEVTGFDPSPGIGTKAASPVPDTAPATLVIPDPPADTSKADKIAADKAEADKVIADQEHGAKVLGDMEASIRNKLVSMSDEFAKDFIELHTAFNDMPDEVKGHTLYKPLAEKISSVEALINTLIHTAASFPEPVVPVSPVGSGPTPVGK